MGERRRGLAATEFAVVLPVLVTFLLGCIDLGRFASRQIAVTSAAQAGAMVGSMEPYTPANLTVWQAAVFQAVEQEMATEADFDPGLLAVAVTPLGDPGETWLVSVSVSYPFQVLVPWPGIPESISLNRTVVVRAGRP